MPHMRRFACLLLYLACACVPARAQDAHADLARARMYRNGVGAPLDPARAAALFQRAAEAGDADAAFTLSNMLRAGEGAPPDLAGAALWLRRAAEAESPEALQQLAMEEADPARAAALLRRAAHALTHRVLPGQRAQGAGTPHR